MSDSGDESDSANSTQSNTNNTNTTIQQFVTTSVGNNNAKFPYLQRGKYEIWTMKMENWIKNKDHNL